MTRAREERQLPRAGKIRHATTIQVTAPTFVAQLQIYRGEWWRTRRNSSGG